ncbi:MAG: SWIM zinc finger family protein [Candidatus Freyarchaeota archaeon]
MKLNVDKIRSLCTEDSFERGLKYFEEGRVKEIEFFEGTVTATVEGTQKYRVTIHVDDDLEADCTCPYDRGGYCKHIVATLIALSKDYKEIKVKKKREEDRIASLLNRVGLEELREFLRAEFEKDPRLRTHFALYFTGEGEGKSVQDYKKEISQLWYDIPHDYGFIQGVEADFSDIQDLAQRYFEKGNFLEAAKIYRALCEEIAENIYIVDDSDRYYRGEFKDAMEKFALCIKEAGLKPEEKKRYINYLFNKYLEKDPDYFQENYMHALEEICTSKEDLEHWRKLLKPHLPKTLPDRERYWSEYYDAKELLMMQAFILDRLGEKKELYALLQKYYREDKDFCLLYAKRLERDGKIDQAVEVAEEGLRLFPAHLTSDIRRFLNKFYETLSPEKYRENLKNLFFQETDWSCYRKLKESSSREEWDRQLQEIITHFTNEEFLRYVLIDIYLEEGMHDKALKEALSANSLATLSAYHEELAPRYPKEYFQKYKELLIPFADSKTGRSHYKHIVLYLKKMKNIKGFENEFRDFVEMLKIRYSNRPAFQEEIRKLT